MKSVLLVKEIIAKIVATPWLPEVFAGLAGILYLILSVEFAHAQWSVLDEGNYIYKGWLFASGQYTAYQAYGPLTNHMPISYLIFGWVQLIFGPGLRTVRYFMIFIGCLLMLGMWLTTRRLAGRWAAALSLWFIALNPFPISDYSIAITEGLVACIIVWILFFILGENRSASSLFAGTVLTGILILTRENMVLVVPVIFLYLLWQHGKKPSFIFLGTVTAFFVSAHIIFWPGIMEVWDRWIPNPLRPFFNDFVFQDIATPLNLPIEQKLFIIFGSMKSNFMAVFSVLAVWIAWPKGGFKNQAQFKTIIFLSVIFVGLYIAHGIASLGKNYCAFCLVNYVTFFSPAGILMFFAFLPGMLDRQPILPTWLAGLLVLLLVAGIGYSNYENFGQPLASINIPRISNLSIQDGTTELWRLLANKFGLTFQILRRVLPLIAGLLVGILIVIAGYALAKISKEHPLLSKPTYALFSIVMMIGLILSPTVALGKVIGTCDKDIILGYEQVGAQLQERVPPGSQIYWRGDASPTPLLYLSNVKIYPPQLNAYFSLRPASKSDRALRYGFWNVPLDRKWINEADVFLLRETEVSTVQKWLSPKKFIELEPTSPTYGCSLESNIRIFQRK